VFAFVVKLHTRPGSSAIARHARATPGVAHLLAVLDPNEVDGVERAACLADRGGHPCERAGAVVEMDAQRRAERRRRVRGAAHPVSVDPPRPRRIRGATDHLSAFPHVLYCVRLSTNLRRR
jgi:hypothetical protein